MIIDCHCHAGAGDGLTGPWDTRAPLRDFMRWSAEAGIHRTVVFAAFHSDYAVANREVARIIRACPGRLLGFAFVHPERDRGRVNQLVREAVEDHEFVGIKVHRHDARITREICEAARAYRLPVLYDVMGEVWVCELLAREYPDVAFIIPHLGSFSDDWRAQLALIDHLVRHPNIFTDTSGVRRFELLREAARRAGAAKILFGSDGPWLHPGVELAKVRALHLTADDEGLVLSGNLSRLLGRVRRTPSLWRRGEAPVSVPLPPPLCFGATSRRGKPAEPWWHEAHAEVAPRMRGATLPRQQRTVETTFARSLRAPFPEDPWTPEAEVLAL